jgi:hypothetical protein
MSAVADIAPFPEYKHKTSQALALRARIHPGVRRRPEQQHGGEKLSCDTTDGG